MKSPVSKSTMKTIGKKTNIKSIAPTLSAACVVIKINLPKINKNNINNIKNIIHTSIQAVSLGKSPDAFTKPTFLLSLLYPYLSPQYILKIAIYPHLFFFFCKSIKIRQTILFFVVFHYIINDFFVFFPYAYNIRSEFFRKRKSF